MAQKRTQAETLWERGKREKGLTGALRGKDVPRVERGWREHLHWDQQLG